MLTRRNAGATIVEGGRSTNDQTRQSLSQYERYELGSV
ncbi:hypothetical protein ABIB28_003684 [Sphingomonas sp. UYEF23]